MEEKKLIRDCFKGKNIFMTGATGFLGKALIEKLLRSCPEVNKIYILVREKKGKVLHERVKEIVSSPLFSLLIRTYPENEKKIIPIAGDIKELRLGLSYEDIELLNKEIHVFLHCAACVRFDDFLGDAILTNLRSIREAAQMALEMKLLEVFVHVSTAYCNVDDKEVVEEILYPPHGNWREAIATAENCDKNILDTLSQKYIGVFPNTYTYTKQLAEHCVNDLLVGKVPTIIYRPTVVIATALDPYQGWMDNFNGPGGLIAAGSTGLIHIYYGKSNKRTDYVPVDFVVKSMIVAVWHKINFGNKNKIDIYHGSTSNHWTRSVDDLCKLSRTIIWDVPSKQTVWFPNAQSTNYWSYYLINCILFHAFPALFLDLALKAAGRQPMIFKLQRKIYVATTALRYFVSNEWLFENKKLLSLIDQMPKEEMHEFDFNILPLSKNNINQFYLSTCSQARLHLLKQGEVKDHEYSKILRLYILATVCRWIFYGLVIWLVFYKINIIAIMWTRFCSYLDSL